MCTTRCLHNHGIDKFATYDADSGEEEWLGKLTDGHCGENSVSLEKFEEITDAFEKTAFCNPDNKINQSWAIVLCSGTGTNTWWMSINIGRKNRSRNDLLS